MSMEIWLLRLRIHIHYELLKAAVVALVVLHVNQRQNLLFGCSRRHLIKMQESIQLNARQSIKSIILRPPLFHSRYGFTWSSRRSYRATPIRRNFHISLAPSRTWTRKIVDFRTFAVRVETISLLFTRNGWRLAARRRWKMSEEKRVAWKEGKNLIRSFSNRLSANALPASNWWMRRTGFPASEIEMRENQVGEKSMEMLALHKRNNSPECAACAWRSERDSEWALRAYTVNSPANRVVSVDCDVRSFSRWIMKTHAPDDQRHDACSTQNDLQWNNHLLRKLFSIQFFATIEL